MSHVDHKGRRRSTRVSQRDGPTQYLNDVSFTLHVPRDPLPRIQTCAPTVWVHGERHTADTTAVAFRGNQMTLISNSATRHTFVEPKGFFTLSEFMACVQLFETEDRPKSNWFGGVDRHHVFFDGVKQTQDGYRILWGS